MDSLYPLSSQNPGCSSRLEEALSKTALGIIFLLWNTQNSRVSDIRTLLEESKGDESELIYGDWEYPLYSLSAMRLQPVLMTCTAIKTVFYRHYAFTLLNGSPIVSMLQNRIKAPHPPNAVFTGGWKLLTRMLFKQSRWNKMLAKWMLC